MKSINNIVDFDVIYRDILSDFIAMRKTNGDTQETIAQKLNVNRATISAWENGKTKIPIEKYIYYATLSGMPFDFSEKLPKNTTYKSEPDYSLILDNPLDFFPVVFPKDYTYKRGSLFSSALDLHFRFLYDTFNVDMMQIDTKQVPEEFLQYDPDSWQHQAFWAALTIKIRPFDYHKELSDCHNAYQQAIDVAPEKTEKQDKTLLCIKADLICFYLLCSCVIDGAISVKDLNISKKGKDKNSKNELQTDEIYSPYYSDEKTKVVFDTIWKFLHSDSTQNTIFLYLSELSKDQSMTELAAFQMALLYYFNLISNGLSRNYNKIHGINSLATLARVGNEYALDFIEPLILFDASYKKKSRSRKDIFKLAISEKK